MEYLYEEEQDCTSLLEQANLQEKELRNKTRWLIGLPTSPGEFQFQIQKPLPEYLLREDDVSYETIKSFIFENTNRKCNTIVQDDMQLIHSPRNLTSLLSVIDNMTNQGLLQFAEVLTGGSIKLEKTRWKMKQIIKGYLSKQNNTRKINLLETYSWLLKNPHNFCWSSESRFFPDSDSYHVAVHKILNVLEDLPTQTLSAMHRKLKSTMPQLTPKTKKSGWGRETLIKGLRKKCLGFLSKLKQGDSLQEPLAEAMEVAALNLKLIQGCQFVTNFKQFPHEISVLQNEIAMCIQLVDKKLELSVLKDIKGLLDPDGKVYDRTLRVSVRNLLTDYLFECGDMDIVPRCLHEVVAMIRKNSHKQSAEMKIEEEVECILSVSASMKQVLWDVIPEHELELDVEFADAYMEDLKDSDSDISEHDGSSNSDEQVASNFNVVEKSCSLSFSKVKHSERTRSTRYHLVSLKDTEHTHISEKNPDVVSSEERNLMFENESMCKNQYLSVQAASDEASMVAYGLIGRMLNGFAQIQGCELNSGDMSYLGVRTHDLKQKKRKAARKEPATYKEDGCSVLIKAVEELIPSFAECEADKLKEMMGCIQVRQ